nr:MAG TPA: vasidilator-stimulated phosphoprotein [Caudoviricetes sp.]
MLEEKDLQAIAQLMEKQKQEIMSETKGLLSQQKQDIMHDVKVLLDTEVTPKFNLLAENQSIMMEKLERLDDIEVMDTRITALEAMVKKLNRDVEKLKRAQ